MTWLLNKVAADLDITTERVAQDKEMTLLIQKYIVAEIESYSDLLRALYAVKEKANVR